MSDLVYPVLPGLTPEIERSYELSTLKTQAVNGHRVTQVMRPYPLRTWGLRYEFLRERVNKRELSALVGFFLKHYGDADDFLFEDPADNTAVNAELGTGNGVLTAFQLRRPLGGFYESITAPKAIQAVRVNGALTTAYTANMATGILTFSVPVPNGHVVKASFTYYWRAAFADPKLSVKSFAKGFFESQRVTLEQVIP